MNRNDLKANVDALLPANPAQRSIKPAADNTFRKLMIDNLANPDDDAGDAAAILAGGGAKPLMYLPGAIKTAIDTIIASALASLVVEGAGYLGSYANTGAAPTTGVPLNSVSVIAGVLSKWDGSNWVSLLADLSGTDVIALIDAEIGDTWKGGGSGGSGGAGTYLINYPNAGAAPTDGVPDGAYTLIADDLHKFNASTSTWENVSDELTDAEVIQIINTELGSSDWQSGGSGGGSAGFDWTLALGGFSGSDITNWAESAGALTSITDLKSAQLYVPTNAGDLLFNAANKYFSANGVDAKLDINNGDNNYLSPGAGVFTIFGIFLYNGSNSDRHIKFQNNGGANTYKINPTGLEIRNSGVTTETIAYSFTSGTTYFLAIQRMPNGKHRLYVGSSELDVQFVGESVATSTTDLGGVNEITIGDTERCHLFLMFHEYLTEPTINSAFQQAKNDFTLG